MTLSFWNAVSGRLEPFRPAAAPVVDFLWKRCDRAPEDVSARRQAAFVGALMDLLVYLGYSLNQNTRPGENVDLYCSEDPLEPAPRCWLRLAEARGAAPPGTDPEVWKLHCLGTAFGEVLTVSCESLERAQADLERLRRLFAGLTASHGTAQAASAGLAGYIKRFRDALCRNADFPQALSVLWDGLRPGALSPASQLGLLREAQAALGLGLDNARGGC